MERFGRGPVTVWLLIGAIALAHVALSGAPAARAPVEYAFAVIPLRFAGGAEGFASPLGWAGPLFGHVFLHAPGFLHVGMNLLVLAQVGGLVNRRLGGLPFLLLFFASAAAAALAYVGVNPASPVPAVGASGAVSGVFAAYLFAVRPQWRDALSDRRILQAGFWFLAVNVGLAFLAARSGFLPIAWEAHLGGFLAGLVAYPVLSEAVGRRAAAVR